METKPDIISFLNSEYNDYLYYIAEKGFLVKFKLLSDIITFCKTPAIYLFEWDKNNNKLFEIFSVIKSVNPEHIILLVIKEYEGNLDSILEILVKYVDDFIFFPISKEEFFRKIRFWKLRQDVGMDPNVTFFRKLSYIDELTKVGNRRAIMKRLREEINRFNRHNIPFSVFLLDIDRFKLVNDFFGHNEGDFILRKLSEVLLNSIRNTDFVGRYGGEEFLIIFTDTDESTAFNVAQKIREKIEKTPFRSGFYDYNITISGGIAEYEKGESIDSLIDRADKALYVAKNTGRNKIISYTYIKEGKIIPDIPYMKPNILIVDDNPDLHEIIKAAFRNRSFHFLSAYNGYEALTLLEKNNVDLILLDVILPDISGIDFVKKIKRKYKNYFIPVIMISAVGEQSNIIEGYQAGCDDFILKPIDIEILKEKIKSFLKIKHQIDDKIIYLSYLNKIGPEILRHERLKTSAFISNKISHKFSNILMKYSLKFNLQREKKKVVSGKLVEMMFNELDDFLYPLNMVSSILNDVNSQVYEDLTVKNVIYMIKDEIKEFKKEKMIKEDFISIQASEFVKEKKVSANKKWLRFIIRELLNNSWKFNEKMPVILINIKFENRKIILEYIETQKNINEEYINRLIEPYFQINPNTEGMGLGLTLVYIYVKKMNANMKIINRKENLVFLIEFPEQKKILLKDKEKKEKPIKIKNARVLIIEDDYDIGMSIKNELECMEKVKEVRLCFEGYTVHDIIEHQEFDIYIIDIGLIGISGFEILDEIKTKNDKLVFIITGLRNISKEEFIEKLEVQEVFFKPFEIAKLKKALEKYLL